MTELTELDVAAFGGDTVKLLAEKRRQMHAAADQLDFETAALIRDEIRKLEEGRKGTKKKTKASVKKMV